MANLVFTDGRVEVNSVVLSTWVKSVQISYSARMEDDSVMGDTTKSSLAGLKEVTVQIEGLQDYAAGGPDATLFSLIGAAAFNVKVRPTTAAISATNPEFVVSCVLASYNPASGAHGEMQRFSASFNAAGNLARNVA